MIIFLHGVPETAAIWRKVQAAIGVESVALELPGFGCPRPDGFTSTADEYAGWVAERLDQYDTVDLVGHDWGAGLVYRLAMTRPLRSWVADLGNTIHPGYVPHDLARAWQTPGVSEAAIERLLGAGLADRTAQFMALGIEEADAREMAAGVDRTMGESILPLYRSATPNPHAHWGPLRRTESPGMVLHATGDQFADVTQAREVAAALGATVRTIDAGHFWPYQAPEQAAALLTGFWASVR